MVHLAFRGIAPAAFVPPAAIFASVAAASAGAGDDASGVLLSLSVMMVAAR